ncbi:formin-like family [Cryptosporidium bovis]|uniref:formin-like family n=1 Tax=Cryptosporidium bovis TaxID=310047 RepID=UPI00351A0054|nr:formin-like family [Cryptosporidium bovis]
MNKGTPGKGAPPGAGLGVSKKALGPPKLGGKKSLPVKKNEISKSIPSSHPLPSPTTHSPDVSASVPPSNSSVGPVLNKSSSSLELKDSKLGPPMKSKVPSSTVLKDGDVKGGLTTIKSISKAKTHIQSQSSVQDKIDAATKSSIKTTLLRDENKLYKNNLSNCGSDTVISNRNTFVESTLPFEVGPINRLLFQDRSSSEKSSRKEIMGKNSKLTKREDGMFNLHVSVLDPALTETAEHSLAALTQTFKEEFATRHFTLTTTEKNNLLFGQTARAKPQMINEKFGAMTDSLLLLQKLEESRGGEVHEIQRIIQRLRTTALEKFLKAQYSESMLSALHCYEISRAFLTKYLGHPLEGIMVIELIILAKCCGLTGELKKGEHYLKELRLLIENTILSVADKKNDSKIGTKSDSNVNKNAAMSGNPHNNGSGAPSGSAGSGVSASATVMGPTISCDSSVLCSLVLTTADLCSLYRDHVSASFYFDKYLTLVSEVYGQSDLVMSDAYSTVASYYFRIKNFEKCKELILNCLEIRRAILGDHNKNPPHPRVADCYSNLGLVCRVLGDCREGVQYIMIALDMLMRIYNNRDFPLVQDNILALGCIFHQAGNFRYALELYNEVYRYRKSTLGFEHPDTRFVLELINQLDADTQVYLTENIRNCTDSIFVQDIQRKGLESKESMESSAENYIREIIKESLSKSSKINRMMYEESSILASPICPSIDQLRYRQVETFLIDPKNSKGLNKETKFTTSQTNEMICTSRIRALHGEVFQSLTISSTAILPHLKVRATGPDHLAVSTMLSLPPFAKSERKKLPIINIPKLTRGYPVIGDQSVVMIINEDAQVLLAKWNIPEPCVTPDGKLIAQNETDEETGLPMYLKLVDFSGKEEIEGYFKEPIWIPNAIIPLVRIRNKKKSESTKTQKLIPQMLMGGSRGFPLDIIGFEQKLPPDDILSKITGSRPDVEEIDSIKFPCISFLDSDGLVITKLPYVIDMDPFVCASTRIALNASSKWSLPAPDSQNVLELLSGRGLGALIGSMINYKPTDGNYYVGLTDLSRKAGKTGGLSNLLEGIGKMEGVIGKASHSEEAAKATSSKSDAGAKETAPKSGPAKGAPPSGPGKGPPGKGKGPPGKGKGPPGGKGPPSGKGPPKSGKSTLKVGGKGGSKATGPESKTKKLHWDKVENIQGTIWDIKDTIKLDFGNLEEIFGVESAKPKKAAETTKKPKVMQILPDSKKAYNMSIALSKFNAYTFQQLRDAILDLDSKILTVEATEALLLMIPTPEEFAIVKEYIDAGGDLTQLDKPEQYVAAMIGIPMFGARLNAQLFILSFENSFKELSTPLLEIISICNEIKTNIKLKKVFSIILSVGNMLNINTEKGNAKGFRMSSLSKLCEVRSSTKPVKTLLQYISEIIWRDKPELLSLAEPLALVENAMRCDLGVIEGEIQSLNSSIEKITDTMKTAQKNNERAGPMGEKDPIAKILADFVSDAEPKVEDLVSTMSSVKENLEKMALYLGEPQNAISRIVWPDYFRVIWNFISNVENVRKTKLEEEKRLKQKQENLAKKEKAANTVKIRLSEKKSVTQLKKTVSETKPTLQKQKMTVNMAPKANAVKTSKLDEMASWFASDQENVQTPLFLQEVVEQSNDTNIALTDLGIDVDLW